MPENEVTPSPDYLKGFNQGYIMAKHEPQLIEQILPSLGDSERGTGFKQGKEAYEAEKQKEHTPSWLKKDAFSDLDKGRDHEKDLNKDDLDRE